MPLLEVEELAVSFETPSGTVRAVDGLSLTIERGERVGIVGESGSGKSVTALAILGLVPASGHVTAGRLAFEGDELLTRSERQLQRWRGRHASMVFQDPLSSLNPFLRVGRQVAETLEVHLEMSRAEAGRRAAELLARVGIADAGSRLRDYPHQFSGGMRQRVAIAIAMACAPELLIADEPTTSLDVTVQAQILDVLAQLSTASGTAVILITHDLGVVAGFCDRLLVMYAGRIVESGPTDAVVGEPQHPYTRGLLESIPRLRGHLPARLRSVEGSPPEIGALLPGCAFAPRCPLAMPVCLEETPRLEPVPGEGQVHRVVACHAVARGYVPVTGTGNGEVAR